MLGRLKWIFLTLLAMALPASGELSSHLVPQHFRYMLYDQGRIIKQGDYSGNYIQMLFEDEKSGWRKNWVTYVPQLKWVSEHLIITCLTTGKVIVNYTVDGKQWQQVAKQSESLCQKLLALADNQ